MRSIIADKGYDAGALRRRLQADDEARYKGRWRIEAAFCCLKDFRRIATRYDKLARNFLSAVALTVAIAFGS